MEGAETMDKQLTKLVSMFVLGDGGVYYSSIGSEAKFIMNMKEENEDYCQWCASVMREITSVRITRVLKGGNRKPQLRVETAPHPIFSQLREAIYIPQEVGFYKGFPEHYMKLLDAEAVAILYMSDGSYQSILRPSIGMVNPSPKITLNMKRLSQGDTLLLRKYLINLGHMWNINRQNQYYYLSLRTKDALAFSDMVSPHILPSFKYKLIRTTGPLVGDDIVRTSMRIEESAGNTQTPDLGVTSKLVEKSS